jgi:hypothetical protein
MKSPGEEIDVSTTPGLNIVTPTYPGWSTSIGVFVFGRSIAVPKKKKTPKHATRGPKEPSIHIVVVDIGQPNLIEARPKIVCPLICKLRGKCHDGCSAFVA